MTGLHGEGWETLPASRKRDIAHAQAIHTRYGELAGGGGCGSCAESGLSCKVYSEHVRYVLHMDLGLSCQNCRIRGTTCDLTSDLKSDFDVADEDTTSGGIRPSGEKPREISAGEEASTEINATPDPESRLLVGTSIPSTGSEDVTPGASEEQPQAVPSPEMMLTRASVTSEILDFAGSIGLQIPHPLRRPINEMHQLLQDQREVMSYDKRSVLKKHHDGSESSVLEQYYKALIILYILAHKQGHHDLAYIVLVRFQQTNYAKTTQLPLVDTVVRAFQHLPSSSPLCRWLVILYAYLWETQSEGHYDAFTHKYVNLDQLALLKLMYEISYIRDPFTKGFDAAVLAKWCNVHKHIPGSPEQKLCQQMQSETTMSVEEAKKKEIKGLLESARETIEVYAEQPAPESHKRKRGRPRKESESGKKTKLK